MYATRSAKQTRDAVRHADTRRGESTANVFSDTTLCCDCLEEASNGLNYSCAPEGLYIGLSWVDIGSCTSHRKGSYNSHSLIRLH